MEIENRYECPLRIVVTRWDDLTVTNSDGDTQTTKEEVPDRTTMEPGQSMTLQSEEGAPIRRVYLCLSKSQCPDHYRRVQPLTIRGFPTTGSAYIRLTSSGTWDVRDMEPAKVSFDQRLVPTQTIGTLVAGGVVFVSLLIFILLVRRLTRTSPPPPRFGFPPLS